MGLFGEMHLPVTLVLRLQVAPPLTLIADVAQAWQAAGIDAVIAGTQQADNSAAPDFFHVFLFKKQVAPDVVFDVKTATGDGDVDMRVLIQLPAVGVQCAEDADINTLFACPVEHGAGGTAKQVVEQGPVIVEERPQQVGHRKSDVLPVAIGQDVLLFSNSLLGGFHATTAAGLGFATLAEEARVCTVG